MFYTYILESTATPGRRYIGHTADLRSRLQAHNEGCCSATRHHRPWRLWLYVAFRERLLAIRFEAYLKSGSGHAFANRHFTSEPR